MRRMDAKPSLTHPFCSLVPLVAFTICKHTRAHWLSRAHKTHKCAQASGALEVGFRHGGRDVFFFISHMHPKCAHRPLGRGGVEATRDLWSHNMYLHLRYPYYTNNHSPPPAPPSSPRRCCLKLFRETRLIFISICLMIQSPSGII